jgi:uncharacterized protein with PIN domain
MSSYTRKACTEPNTLLALLATLCDARARGDGRLLLTASRSLIKRKACRTGFFVDPRKLEASLAQLCKLYSLRPAASELLTRCVKCNGRILKVDETHRAMLRQRSDVPAALVAHGATTELFCCNGCQQVSIFTPPIC